MARNFAKFREGENLKPSLKAVRKKSDTDFGGGVTLDLEEANLDF